MSPQAETDRASGSHSSTVLHPHEANWIHARAEEGSVTLTKGLFLNTVEIPGFWSTGLLVLVGAAKSNVV